MGLESEQKKAKYAIIKQFGKKWYLNKNIVAFKLRLKIIERFLLKKKPISILDIGTGDGKMLLELYNNKFPIMYAVGIDISLELIRIARLYLKYKKKKYNLHFINADSDFLPFRNGIFNSILGTALVEHLLNPYSTIKEMKRVASKTSQIIITTPNPLYFPLFKLLSRLKLKYEENEFNNPQTLTDLKRIFEKLNLKIRYSSGFLPFPFIIDRVLSMISFKGYHFLINQIIIGEKVVDS